jgi:ethanolaminephosphotransferase
VLREVSGLALLTRTLPVAVYTVLVMLMRHHLFVWTVFSPKLLYEGCLIVVIIVFSVSCLLMAKACEMKMKL